MPRDTTTCLHATLATYPVTTFMSSKMRNVVHKLPVGSDLRKLRLDGIEAVPIVKIARHTNGKRYYPVIMPFDARIICPWCGKVAIAI